MISTCLRLLISSVVLLLGFAFDIDGVVVEFSSCWFRLAAGLERTGKPVPFFSSISIHACSSFNDDIRQELSSSFVVEVQNVIVASRITPVLRNTLT